MTRIVRASAVGGSSVERPSRIAGSDGLVDRTLSRSVRKIDCVAALIELCPDIGAKIRSICDTLKIPDRILKNGSDGAVVFHSPEVDPESVFRHHETLIRGKVDASLYVTGFAFVITCQGSAGNRFLTIFNEGRIFHGHVGNLRTKSNAERVFTRLESHLAETDVAPNPVFL